MQKLKRSRHLLTGQEAFAGHHVFEQAHLGFVDQHAHLARVGEIDFGRQQAQRSQRRGSRFGVLARQHRVTATEGAGGHGGKGAPRQ